MEIVLSIASYLDQADVLRASQVNGRWRIVTHACPDLWRDMIINVDFRRHPEVLRCRAVVLDQCAFYDARLRQLQGRSALRSLSIHGQANILIVAEKIIDLLLLRVQAKYWLFVGLEAISLSNIEAETVKMLLKACMQSASLKALRVSLYKANPINFIAEAYQRFPDLENLELSSSDRCVPLVSDWYRLPPVEGTAAQTSTVRKKLRRFAFYGDLRMEALEGLPTAVQVNSVRHEVPLTWISEIQSVDVRCNEGIGYFLVRGGFSALRSLTLQATALVLDPTISWQHDLSHLSIAERTARLARSQLVFENLEELTICMGHSKERSMRRTDFRPLPILLRLRTPRIIKLRIGDYGLLEEASIEKTAFTSFAAMHPKLRSLELVHTAIPGCDLEKSLKHWRNLHTLNITSINFRDSRYVNYDGPSIWYMIETMQSLRHLSLDRYTGVLPTNLRKLVLQRKGKLYSLYLSRCCHLHEVALKWFHSHVSAFELAPCNCAYKQSSDCFGR